MIGQTIAHYRVTAKLGAGGMGEVYRATDSKLGRDVALKVLPEAFAQDSQRMARFQREAQLLASLNHPNIAAIHGLEHHGNTQALAMELVEGPTLAERIAGGALPLDEALPIAKQIAEALEYAHEKGIIHRDLKPANIKLTKDGQVKILDFGLAKALEDSPAAQGISNSPTISMAATKAGLILGTAAYMSPEQARGKSVDRRADIWSFGVVLFEMLTGRQVFVGETVTDVMAAVVRAEPDWAILPKGLPPRVRLLLRRCLTKDEKLRLRDMGEARLILSNPDEPEFDHTSEVAPARGRRWPAAVVLLVVAIAAAAISWYAKPEPPTPLMRLSIALLPGEQVTTVPAISPDGQTIAYAAGRTRETSQLYLRALNSFSARAVDSSAGAQYPFFSPDGRSIAFFAGGKLWRTLVAGGAPTAIATVPKPWGGTWGVDGRIVYVPNLNAGLWRVPAEGGSPEQLTKPDGAASGYAHTFPQRLPGAGDILFAFWGQTFYVALFSGQTGNWREVTPPRKENFVVGTYAENGHLMISDRAGGIRAASWNPDTTALTTPEAVVLDNVYWVPGAERAWVSASANGTVVFAPGSPSKRHLVWVNRQGQITQIPGEAITISMASVSRDGRRVVHQGLRSTWVVDQQSGASTRIVDDTLAWNGKWLPGDQRLVVSSNKSGDWDLYTVATGGNSDLKPLLQKPFTQHPMSVGPDGTVVYMETHPVTGFDLWTLKPDGQTVPLVVSPFNENSASISADGKYVAYVSDESGRNQVYVIPASGKGERVTVSIEGGTGPVWSRDGRELFYRAGNDLISVQVRATRTMEFGERRKLLDVSGFEPGYFHDFDLSADGQRFLMIRAEPGSRPMRLDVVLNWFPELTKFAGKQP